MRVLCRHGHFAFYPVDADEVGRFTTYFGIELEQDRDFYTFPKLAGAPGYSLRVLPYLGTPATATYAGEPWEVMRENGFVYSLQTKLLVPKLSIVSVVDFPQTGYFFKVNGFVQPGSRTILGRQVLGYDGEFVQSTFQLRISRLSYE